MGILQGVIMHRRQSSILFIALMLFAVLFSSHNAFAGTVVKIKGKKVFIKLDSSEVDSTFKGDKIYITNKAGKKTGYVIVKKMKGPLVIAAKGKGKVKKGDQTLASNGKGNKKKGKKSKKKKLEKMEDASEVARTESDTGDWPEMMLGVMGSFGTASQNVSGVVDMSGSTTGFKGIFDYELFSDFGVQTRLGIEQLSVTGTDAGNNEFETIISYITLDLLLRYYLYRGKSFGFFLNGGMGIYSPMSTDLKGGTDPNNPGAIQEDSISTTSLLIFGAGIAIPFSGWEIQLGGEYFYFPPSDDVDTSVINGKLAILFEI